MTPKKSLVFTLCVLFSLHALAERSFIGTGYGSLYQGLGLSCGVKTPGAYKYVSSGMGFSYKSEGPKFTSYWGAGVGFMKTGLLFAGDDKHGVGMNLGAQYSFGSSSKFEGVYLGPVYTYYLNGIDARGEHLGFTIMLFSSNQKTRLGLGVTGGFIF